MFRGRKKAKGGTTGHSGDVELFARHLRGDHDALMSLFDKYNERLWLFCTRMLGDSHHGKDVVQELWEKVILLREKNVDVPDRPMAYLFTMARNLSLNHIRSRKNMASLDDLAESDHPEERLKEPSQQEELMVLALQRLPESQREVLVLNAYSGYSFEEIGEILGKASGAIHTTAWRARKRLGEIFAELMKEENKRIDNSL